MGLCLWQTTDKKLGGSAAVEMHLDEADSPPLKIVLADCGSAMVRLVDRDQRPIKDASGYEQTAVGTDRGDKLPIHSIDNVATALENLGRGRYRVTGLLPGPECYHTVTLSYAGTTTETKPFTVTAGREMDLGTLAVNRLAAGEPAGDLLKMLADRKLDEVSGQMPHGGWGKSASRLPRPKGRCQSSCANER